MKKVRFLWRCCGSLIKSCRLTFSFLVSLCYIFSWVFTNLIVWPSLVIQGAYLINIARGGLLDYGAVAQNLKSGYLGGLGIDVAWTEPFDPNDPILQLPNVLITPHVAGVTDYSYRSMAKVLKLSSL